MYRAIDISISIIVIFLCAPIILFISLLIKLTSKGNLIYKQKRIGLKGRTFMLYKFRSMVMDAEKHTGPVWAEKNDNRVTKIGKILRRTRLDELPQLFNVLKGNMSLVGPVRNGHILLKSIRCFRD